MGKKKKASPTGGWDPRGGYIAGSKTASEMKPPPPAFVGPKIAPPDPDSGSK
jgi:hypothetical protein